MIRTPTSESQNREKTRQMGTLNMEFTTSNQQNLVGTILQHRHPPTSKSEMERTQREGVAVR
ncbi:hypothetical protein MUK42_05470 [Musa troglodytarum]|uniref:Uncharacterized protein n=1 Tax=Musa troglodytarum TaxID=320322 RepID=A0A9E7KBI9_9LILI|nr:hypothetical protein MUK42_05470 [Musa troglodytarum]